MDPENKSKKNSEPKSGSNYLLLFIFLLVVSLIASMAVYNNAGFSISYKEFTDYLQKKEESEDKENFSFLVFREQGDRKSTIRISNLRKILIGDRRINGTFDWKDESGKDSQSTQKNFVVFKPLQDSEESI